MSYFALVAELIILHAIATLIFSPACTLRFRHFTFSVEAQSYK